MTLHLHHLTGCAPAPLAHYLKALGVLRIVAEQKDRQARGWWQDEHFCLLTKLSRDELEELFLDEYAPTPFVSPWNKGSGFYQKNDPALHPLETSSAARFAPFRAGVVAARAQLATLAEADSAVRALKDRTKAKKGMSTAEKNTARALKSDPAFKAELAAAGRRFKALKTDLFTPCLRSWRGPHRQWLDAAMVWLDAEDKPAWPSLLGTGGNDGRLDFTNNAMQRLGELFDLGSVEAGAAPRARQLLEHAFWSTPCDDLVAGAAIGQFLPGSAGGANSSNGAGGDSLVNPWDFVLMLEGAVLFSARATRRLDPAATSRASAPFAVRAHAAGHGTRGREKAVRGEQWMPLWSRATSASGLETMLAEARLQLGRQLAHRPIDVARAISRLGVARGISGFTRFGYLERNGQSNIAVALGRIEVCVRPRARLVDDLGPWLDRLQRYARDEHAPARLVHAEGALADAVFAVLTHDDSAQRWQAVLTAASRMEAVQASGTAVKAGPIPALSPEWLRAADDGSVEWRLAGCLGSAAGHYDVARRSHDPVRHHWLALEPGARRFKVKDGRLVGDVRVVACGRDAVADCGALCERRLVEALQHGQRLLPLMAARGWGADPCDLAELSGGRVDLDRVLALARALMAVRWQRCGSGPAAAPAASTRPDEAWMALRLTCLPWPLDESTTIHCDGAMLRRLVAGDGATAVDVALRRLRAVGLRPPLQAACTDASTARLWAAALAFPITRRSALAMARQLAPSMGHRQENP